eukprot:TRINITY_DN37501_c0_g1_i1.p1 TRINITY_DN37501_c0_g1~~TRINITY_DN37501_c0_g1_i1.p1  ORF type:complete len:645 (-),score=60.47 TRINITY_DN37501_c0_g1_i1:226-2034(-)
MCLRVNDGESANCKAGVFVELAKQPLLGLRHVELGKNSLPFATLTQGSKAVTFSLACGADDVVQVLASSGGASTLGTSWEVCANGASLNLLLPVVDLTHDMPTSTDDSVDGCVRVSAPRRLPHLRAVRGSMEDQRDALMQIKRDVGGCPSWTSDEDREDRGDDFATVFGRINAWFVRQLMKRAKDVAIKYRHGSIPQYPEPWSLFLFIGTVASGGGEHAATMIDPLMYCGTPGVSALPGINALMVTRHAEVAKLVGDPTQKRGHQIGGGNSEVCFEPTLPVFLSTGEPPHTQTRKLWDAVGLANMHERDVPEIVRLPELDGAFFKVRRAAMSAVGIHNPVLDEVALYVAPLFLEMLWEKKPTMDEAAFIAGYGTVGGPCIMSQIVEKLPIIPGKIKAIREAARKFGLSSPVGKKMADVIHKPEYAELKALLEKRPMGAVEGAVGALADASLFAGLIGTSTMVQNAMVQVHRGKQYLNMFRENSTAFMLEVMRTATAVAGSLQVTKAPMKLVMANESIELPSGNNIIQLTGLGAGLDATIFPKPYVFDSRRTNLGETMNFNGLSKHVLARNYEGAPRFCPGAAISIKIAAKVVDYLTKDMPAA